MLRGDSDNQTRTRFKILGPLGAGGFGAVYEALDARSGTHVALKQLDDTSADSIARFKQEFRALTECHHENLVSVKELIELDGVWLIVMELVPGVDFLRYVQNADNDNASLPPYDEPRLRSALAGMLRGLIALHGFGVVHRDLKPSNVRVRPDGRVVLLDFGLATSVNPAQQSTHVMGLGTATYMAPEQADGRSIGPAVDLYALGVCLFEALTGEAPFPGDSAIRILLEKQQTPARKASSVLTSVPADLDLLCTRLLAIEPAERPTAAEALHFLSHGSLGTADAPTPTAVGEEYFAGRETELSHLARALARTDEGELRVVLLEGESGVGKSELVLEFTRRMQLRHPSLCVLRGRCYENEQVSYKAFDGCIDELSKLLRRLSASECDALMPARAGLLGQLFPVLRNVKSIASAAVSNAAADPSARRLEAFAALSQLLASLSEERPVVLVLDDLQWADAESFRLLAALSEQNPRPPVLLLGTVRPREELDASVRERLELVRSWQHTNVVPVTGLPYGQAKVLARKLLGPSAPEIWLEMIAEESEGHPLFMSELVQYTRSHDFAARGSLTLEAALSARIDRLERRARELLEMVALAARPHPTPVFASALGVGVDEAARTLLVAKLLRQRRGDELGCYHDRIRHAAVDLIAVSRLPALHHRLAAALEKVPDVDPSEAAHHWDLAGQKERASAAYEVSAKRACDALAFAKAAQLYARAIELAGGPFDARQHGLTVKRADALAFAGRYGEASQLYHRAGDFAEGDARIRLRSRAASHLILSGQTGSGLQAAREVLAEIGFSMPASIPRAILRYAWDALWLSLESLRGFALTRNEADSGVALSVLRELRRGITLVDPLAALLLGAQYVRHAMRSASPIEAAFGMAWRALTVAGRGSFARAEPLLAESRRLLVQSGSDPSALAAHAALAGTTCLLGMDWAGACAHLEEAHELARQHCAQDTALLTTIRYALGLTWYAIDQHGKLAREMSVWLNEAQERNDVLATTLLTGMGHGFIRQLMVDAPEKALAELEACLSPRPDDPYAYTHFGQFFGIASTLLYTGGPAAFSYVEQHRAKYGRSFMLRQGTGRQTFLMVRQFSLFSAHTAASPKERPALLRAARRASNDCLRLRAAYPRSIGQLGLAQIAALEGRKESALAHAELAVSLSRDVPTVTRAAKYLLAMLEGGTSGQEKCELYLRELVAHGWQNPQRAMHMYLPACPLLNMEKRSRPTAHATLLLDRYEITSQLGSGGFGAVVAARDVRSGHVLALKELVRKGGASIERFKREFRALSDVHHENIVQLESLFEHQGTWYIAMELVEGVDLVSYVRESDRCDEERLRKVFTGVARALEALHRIGLVHRDVKPENVVVTRDGRAVLIDFGLVARVGAKPDGVIVGSLQYGAPEQLDGAAPDAASDIYSLGACLFHALVGRAPFAQDAGLAQPRPAEAPALPPLPELPALRSLCTRMLANDPSARPPLSEVLVLLSPAHVERASLPSQRLSLPRSRLDDATPSFSLSGRRQELEALRSLFLEPGTDGLTLALIEGESGLGKSALVHQFALSCQQETPSLHVLRGRCYENEQVAFKAFDGAIDQLAEILRSLPDSHADSLVPKRAALLAQLFPALAGVPAIERVGKKGLPADPAARKRAGRECVAQLFASLCAERRLLLIIDDLQWADSESFDLLRALIAHGESLGPMLVLCTLRPSAEIEPGIAAEIEALCALRKSKRIALSSLDEQAATELARKLCGEERDLESLRALARESRGHPLFLRELVEHQQRGAALPSARLTLDAALSARVEGLSAEARALLELVALLGKPAGTHVFARALSRAELPRDALVALLGQGLLQRRGDNLACYHDKIRQVTLSLLVPTQRAQIAGKLAAALSRDLRADPADRARLWDEASEPEEAIAAYELSGNQALENLAFVRAEQDYARALTLLGEDTRKDPRWKRLTIARGHALARAGKSREAAACFQGASLASEGEEHVRLRIWTAQHLIQSAQVEEGMEAATSLLAQLGLTLPASDGAAKARIVYERARVKLRGIQLGTKRATAHERLELEALHGLSSPVRGIAYLPGSALVLQYLRRALNAGDPVHSARALAHEAIWRSIKTADGSSAQLFEQSRALAETTGEPALIAEVDLVRGLSCVMQQQMNVGAGYLSRAHDLLQTQCPGQPWLLTASRMYLGMAWFHIGNFNDLRRHSEGWLEEARARDDRYAIAALCGFGAASFRHLLHDDATRGRDEVDAAMARWPRQPFGTNHAGAFLTKAYMMWCAEDPEMLRVLEAQRQEVESAYLMRVPTTQLALHTLRAVALLRSVERPDSSEGKALIARARATCAALKRVPGKVAGSAYHFFLGWVELTAGDRDAALRCLRGVDQSEAKGVHFENQGMRYTLGHLLGGQAGRAMCTEVEEELQADGFSNFRRALALRLPGKLELLGL